MNGRRDSSVIEESLRPLFHIRAGQNPPRVCFRALLDRILEKRGGRAPVGRSVFQATGMRIRQGKINGALSRIPKAGNTDAPERGLEGKAIRSSAPCGAIMPQIMPIAFASFSLRSFSSCSKPLFLYWVSCPLI